MEAAAAAAADVTAADADSDVARVICASTDNNYTQTPLTLTSICIVIIHKQKFCRNSE